MKSPGQRLDEAFITHKPDGLGLGLWVTRSVVEAHRGRLTIRRHPDGGTEVMLRFPRQATHAARSASPQPAAAH